MLFYSLGHVFGCGPFPGNLKMLLLFSEIKVLILLYNTLYSEFLKKRQCNGWDAHICTNLGSAICSTCDLGQVLLLLLGNFFICKIKLVIMYTSY